MKIWTPMWPQCMPFGRRWSRTPARQYRGAHATARLDGRPRVQGDKITVSLQGQMHVDWFNEKPQRVGYVISQLNAASGREHRLELRAGKKKPARPEQIRTVKR